MLLLDHNTKHCARPLACCSATIRSPLSRAQRALAVEFAAQPLSRHIFPSSAVILSPRTRVKDLSSPFGFHVTQRPRRKPSGLATTAALPNRQPMSAVAHRPAAPRIPIGIQLQCCNRFSRLTDCHSTSTNHGSRVANHKFSNRHFFCTLFAAISRVTNYESRACPSAGRSRFTTH